MPLAKTSAKGAADHVVLGTGQFAGNAEPRPIGGVNGKDGVTLNLVDASVAEAARSILGDTLGLNYSVSERVKGAITIQTTKAIPRDALLETFEVILRGEGQRSSLSREYTELFRQATPLPQRGYGAKAAATAARRASAAKSFHCSMWRPSRWSAS